MRPVPSEVEGPATSKQKGLTSAHSTRHLGGQCLAQGYSTLLVPLAFRNVACHEQTKKTCLILRRLFLCVEWWRRRESNPRPEAFGLAALHAYSVLFVSRSVPTDRRTTG